MGQGLPSPQDGGLRGTQSWGRTYWDGALFWLLADLQIREHSRGRFSLRDGLRAVVAQGGHGGVRWSAERTIAVIDEASGNSGVQSLFITMAERPVTTDLSALWASLGLEPRGGLVLFHEEAFRAALRRSLTTVATRLP